MKEQTKETQEDLKETQGQKFNRFIWEQSEIKRLANEGKIDELKRFLEV